MNMISTGAFQTEMDASDKPTDLVSKLVSAWEKKNAKVARAGGVSLMALSLAACGSSDDDSSSSADTTTTTTTTSEPGTTSTLTAGIDRVEGGAGDDIINAGLTSSGQQTLTALDSLNGGAGTDTIAVVMSANATPASTSVEVYTITATAASTLNMLGSTGVTSITNTGSTNVLTVSNVSLGTTLNLSNTNQGGTFNYAAADVAGTADSATINIESVTGGALTVGAGVETLTLNSAGSANTLGSLSSGATTLNITGDQNMTITGNATATTIDASAATGKITVTSDNTKAVSITTGSGADSVTMTGSNTLTDTIDLGAGNDSVTFTATLDDADVVSGGEGTDTVIGISADLAALTSAATTSNLTNFEVVQVSDQSGADLDVSNIQEDGITTVTLAHSGANLVSGARQITGEADSLTVNLGKSAAGNSGALGAALTVTDGADNSTTTDTATINNTGINTTTGANLALNADLTSTGYENLVFNTGSGSGNTEQAMPTITITSDAASAPVTLTLKGNNAIDISTQVSTNSTSLTVDGSALKAQAAGTTTFEIDSTTIAATGTLSITGSDGEDIFGDATAGVHASLATTINSGAGVDTIFTGTGNDTVNAGSGKDVIDTSSGNDTIDAGADDDTIDMAGNLTLKDSIDGGDGTDTLQLNNTDATTVNAYSLGQVATLNGRISNIEKIDFGTGSLTQSIDVGRLDNISTVEFTGLGGASSILGLAATNEVILREDTGATLTLGLADATGTADVLNITMKESDALTGNTITAANIETINIKGIDDAAGDASTVNTMTLVASKATSVVVTGNDGLNLTSTGSTRITNFDASAVAATNSSDTAANMAVTYTSANSSASAAVTIKGGAGNDVLQGNAGVDTISGGAGTDSITMTAGNDVVTGGAGADTYLTTEALMIANSGTTATFDGGAGTDILDFNEDAVINVVDADFRGFTSVESLTTGNGTNNVVMAGNADAAGFTSITGGTGADTFNLADAAFDNAITIDLAGGADALTLSTDVAQVATVNQDQGDSVVADGGTANAGGNAITATETLTFANGVDTITGFTGGTDKIDFTNTGAAVTGIGVTENDLTEDTIFFLSGAFSGTTFTIAADGAGADTLVFENETTGANDDLATVNNIILLSGVDSDDLTATTFV